MYVTSTDYRKKRGAWGRGTSRKHRTGYEVRVPAGTDPVTGKRLTLQETAPTLREAEKLRTKLLAEADGFKSARTNASLGYLLDRWLPQHDIDEDTRESYESLTFRRSTPPNRPSRGRRLRRRWRVRRVRRRGFLRCATRRW